jgi:hypothetical protein
MVVRGLLHNGGFHNIGCSLIITLGAMEGRRHRWQLQEMYTEYLKRAGK